MEVSKSTFYREKKPVIAYSMKSQDLRSTERNWTYNTKILKKISLEDRDTLFAGLKKGQNTEGGKWGKRNSEIE